jgi:NADH dehydrogenase FAD-containing subunit
VESIDAGGVVVAGRRIDAGTVIWGAGIMASPAAGWLGATLDRAGRVPLNPDLSVKGVADVYALKRHDITLNRFGIPKSIGF